jgi:hypothetical protein
MFTRTPPAIANSAAQDATVDTHVQTPAQPPKAKNTSKSAKPLPGKLSGLTTTEKISSALAHAREKMRHRKRDLVLPGVQNSTTGAPIGPPDVARPRYARAADPDIRPPIAPAMPERILRYEDKVRDTTAKAHAYGTRTPKKNAERTLALSIKAARGPEDMLSFVADAFPAPPELLTPEAQHLLTPPVTPTAVAVEVTQLTRQQEPTHAEAADDPTAQSAADEANAADHPLDPDELNELIRAALETLGVLEAGAMSEAEAADATAATLEHAPAHLTPLQVQTPPEIESAPSSPASSVAVLSATDAQRQLVDRLTALPAPPGAASASYGAMLLSAFENNGIRDPRVAEQVCVRMQTLSLDEIVHTATTPHGDPVTQLALKAMRTLSRGTSYNWDALRALRSKVGQDFSSDTQARAVRDLFSSADHLMTLLPRRACPGTATPVTIAEAARQHATAGGAKAADINVALRVFDTAVAVAEGGTASLSSKRERYPLFAWRQGDRSELPNTPASKKNHRLQKFTRISIPRVADSKGKRALTAPLRMLGMRKSAVTASTLGYGGVPRDTLQKEQKAMKAPMKEALAELTKVVEMPAVPAVETPVVPAVETPAIAQTAPVPVDEMAITPNPEIVITPAPRTDTTATNKTDKASAQSESETTPPLSAAAALMHADPLGSLVELAGLHIWLHEGGFRLGRIEPDKLRLVAKKAIELAADAPKDIKDKLVALNALSDDELQKTQPFKAIAKRDFSVRTLEQWGKIGGIPKTPDSPFWQQVEILRAAGHPPEQKLETRSVEAARELLVEVVGSLKSGSSLRLSDGHQFGVSTRGLSVAISNAIHASGVPVSVQANLRALRGREAVVELSRSTSGVKIFIGTAKRLQTHVEAGMFAGYKFELGLAEARAGGALSVVFHAGERGESSGIVIEVERTVKADKSGYDDKAMLEKAADIVAALFDEADEAKGEDEPATASEHVFGDYFDDPSVSAAWSDTSSSTNASGVSLTGGLTLNLPDHIKHIFGTNSDGSISDKVERSLLPVGVGPSIGIGWMRDYGQKQDALGDNGAIRVETHRTGGGSRLIGRVGLGMSASTPVGNLGLGLLSLDTPAWNITFHNTRMSTRLQLVQNHGKLNHRASTLDREFAGPTEYIKAVESERDKYVRVYAADETPAGQEPTAEALERAHAKLTSHLQNARANWRPSQTLFTRHRMREHAARALDLNQALYDQIENPDPEDPRVIALAEVNARILKDPDTYMPFEPIEVPAEVLEAAAAAEAPPLPQVETEDKPKPKKLTKAPPRTASPKSAAMMAAELKGRESTARERMYGPNVFVHLATRKAMVAQREFVAESASFAKMDNLDRALPVPDYAK